MKKFKFSYLVIGFGFLFSCSHGSNTDFSNPDRTPANSVSTRHAWQFEKIDTPKGPASYWQVQAPNSVNFISDSLVREREIQARWAEIDRQEERDFERSSDKTGCPLGMARVKGKAIEWMKVLRAQAGACTKCDAQDSKTGCDPKNKCHVYAPSRLKYKVNCTGKEKAGTHCLSEKDLHPVDVCMDRFEYPNIPGENPVVMVTWKEANKLCEAQGKRLCGEDEWTFACEGEMAVPYPFGSGYERNKDCNIDVDQHGIAFNEKNLASKGSIAALREIDRLWAAHPNGEDPRCRSHAGIYNLTGNVDEWTMKAYSGSPYRSILKGGYWGAPKTRCQPATTLHGEDWWYYQIGFRCCKNPG